MDVSSRPGTAESHSVKSIHGTQLIAVLIGILLPPLALYAVEGFAIGALPRAVAALNGFDRYSWPGTSFALTSTIAMPVFAKLSDLYGRKRFYLLGVLLCSAYSILCGAAGTLRILPNGMNQVILASCLLGLAHAAIMVHSFTLVADRFAPSERGRYLGLLAAVSIFPMAVGPSLGGMIADRLSWRWAYSVSVPLEALAMVAVWLTVSDWRPRSARPSIDWAGVGTLLGWVTPLLLALTLVGQGNAPALDVRALLIAAAAALGAFLLVERRAANPLLNLNLFRYPRISLASASIFLTGISVWALGVYLPLFLQGVLGASAARSGVVFGQYVLATIAGNVIGGRLLSRTAWQPRCAFGASGVAAIGLVLLSQMDGSTTGMEILRNVVVCGIGLGALTPTYDVLVQNATPRESLGVASGLTQFLQAMGGAIGLGFFSTMLMRLYHMHIDKLIPQDAPTQLKQAFDNPLQLVFARPNLDSAVSHVQNGASLLRRLLEGSHAGLLSGMHAIFVISAVAMGISCVLSVFLSRSKP